MNKGLNFIRSGLTQVLPKIIEMKYPDIVFADFVTVDSSANPYLDKVVHLASAETTDFKKGLIADNTTTFNTVDVEFTSIEVPLVRWRKSTGWTDIEVERAQLLGAGVDTARVSALNKNAYQTLQRVAFLGHEERADLTGLLTNKTVKNLAGGFAKPIKQMTYDEAITAFTEIFEKVAAQTGNVKAPNTIAIDFGDYAALALLTKPGESSLTAVEFLETSFSKVAGHAVKFKRIPANFATLAKKGKTRLLMYYNDPDYVVWDVPMTPQFEGPYAKDGSQTNFQLLATMAFGAVCFLEPDAAVYVDY